MTVVTPTQVAKIAKLANLEIRPDEQGKFAQQFTQTLEIAGRINAIDTSRTHITSQITDLSNVLRADQVNSIDMLTQAEALQNAPDSLNGFFKVPAILQQ